MLFFVDCACCYRKIAEYTPQRKHCWNRLQVHLPRWSPSSFLPVRKWKPVLIEEPYKARRGYATCLKSIAKSESLQPNWCLYVSATLFTAACLFPLACAQFDTNTKFQSMLPWLSDKYISHYNIIALQVLFSSVHSGLAALRSFATRLVGERLYRVGFATFSLPLAAIMIQYFVTHRYDGIILWQIRTLPGIHELVWLLSFLSFYFLYPGTFRLLEIAAIKEPKLRLFGEGIIRVTRHPQLWGQILWCIGHTLWLGSSFSVVTSLCLVSYHFFGAWHGDYRLRLKYGEEWKNAEENTSIVPFVAVFRGKQKLVVSEFLSPAYLVVTIFTLGLYLLHPNMLHLFGHSS